MEIIDVVLIFPLFYFFESSRCIFNLHVQYTYVSDTEFYYIIYIYFKIFMSLFRIRAFRGALESGMSSLEIVFSAVYMDLYL